MFVSETLLCGKENLSAVVRNLTESLTFKI
jgi:hypothetical protein